MLKDILYIPKFEKLHLKAFGCTISLKTTIGGEKQNSLLEIMIDKIPQLNDVIIENKKQLITLQTSEDDDNDDQHVVLMIKDQSTFSLFWDDNTTVKFIDDLFNIYVQILQDNLIINKINLNFIDFANLLSFSSSGNHFALISKLFYNSKTLGSIADVKQIYTNDITSKFLINHDRICIIDVRGNTSENDILKNKFEENDFDIKVGIAKTNFKYFSNLRDEVFEHLKFANEFISTNIKPKLYDPFENV